MPLGLPRLLAPDPRDEVPKAAPIPSPSASEAPEALRPAQPPSDLPDDMFALGAEEDEASEEWTADESQDLEPSDVPEPPAAPAPAPRDDTQLRALEAQVAALHTRVWLAALGGALLGAALTAAALAS